MTRILQPPTSIQQPPTPTHRQIAATPQPSLPQLVGTDQSRVVVAGAGPAGMATALELARYGIPTVVVEQRGAGTRQNLFNVLPPMQDAIERLTNGKALASPLVPTAAIQLSDRDTGKHRRRVFTSSTPSTAGAAGRGNINAVLAAMKPADAPGADNRQWAKVGIGDVENALRQHAREQYPGIIQFINGVEALGTSSTATHAQLRVKLHNGAEDAIRGAFVVDATSRNLVGSPMMTFPEQTHWVGARFEPEHGSTAIRRQRGHLDDGSKATTIVLPTTDRTMVWTRTPQSMRGAPVDTLRETALRAARAAGVSAASSALMAPAPVTVQLRYATQPAQGRVIGVGDAVRSPYFPTSSGAMTALVHDAPRAADTIAGVLTGDPLGPSVARYAHDTAAASARLMEASRAAMANDAGIDLATLQPGTLV
jgi:2-polyprenyl-6-methoxyphenol hydroxylase-like FAD-dependent oxidoreductase